MTDHKYTDEEVIRALKICISFDCGCFDCCYHSMECNCVNTLQADALDLINRQRAEIAEYQKHIDQDIIYVHRVQAEAVKKFAEKLKKEQEFHVDECDRFVGFVAVSKIDKLVEEMTKGEQNGTVGSTQ